VVASCLPRRHGHHTRCSGLPDPPGLLPSGCQREHRGPAPVPRWRGAHQCCSPLVAARAGPAAGAQPAADLGVSRPGARALRPRGPAGLGSLALPRWPSTAPGRPSSPTAAAACSCRPAMPPAPPGQRRRSGEPEPCPPHGPRRGPAPSRCQSPLPCRRTPRSGWGLPVSTPPW